MADPVRCWAPPEIRPIVPLQRIREYLYVYTALCPWNGENFSVILPYANSEAMNLFLKEFSQQYKDYRVVMVMDRASWHPADDTQQFENIRFISLPARSPELNPVEHFWEYLRENYFHNFYFENIEKLENKLVETILLMEENKNTVQSFAGFHWTFF